MTIKEKYDMVITQREKMVDTARSLGIKSCIEESLYTSYVSSNDELSAMADAFGVDTIETKRIVSAITDSIAYQMTFFMYRGVKFYCMKDEV